MWRLTAAVALAPSALAGCGGGEKPDATLATTPSPAASAATAADALLDRLPGATTEIAVMDLAAARKQLGIAAHTDPADYRISDDPRRKRFDDAALKPLGYLTRP